MGKPNKRRKQKAHNKYRQTSAPPSEAEFEAAQALIAQELSDPVKIGQHLQRFSQMALYLPALAPFRFPARPFVEGLLEHPADAPDAPGDVDPALVQKQTVIEALANQELLDQCTRALGAAQSKASNNAEVVALAAAQFMARNVAREDARPDHAFWRLLFDLSLFEALLSGHLLIQTVMRGLIEDPDALRARVDAQLTHALADSDLARELDALEVDTDDRQALTDDVVGLVQARDLFHFQFDALLHLSHLHVTVAGDDAGRIALSGVTHDEIASLRARYQEAYQNDVTEDLVDETARWFQAALHKLRDDPESMPGVEKIGYARRCGLIYLALRGLDRTDNPILQALHVQSLVRARVQVEQHEEGFVAKLWSNPTDTFALEAYTDFLRQRGERHRAARVRAFQTFVRARRDDA